MSDYWKKMLEEMEEEEEKKKKSSSDSKNSSNDYWQKQLDEFNQTTGKSSKLSEDLKKEGIGRFEGAPMKAEEKKWYQKILKGSSAFDDGYDFGDISKTIQATSRDTMTNIYAGLTGIAEGAIDAGAGLVGTIGGLFGADEFQDKMSEFVAKDIINEKKVGNVLSQINGGFLSDIALGKDKDKIDEFSVSGDTLDSWAQSGGQLLGQMALGAVGVPWYVTAGTTSFGGEMENALNQGATGNEAFFSGLISAGSEILSEKLIGGSGLGEKGVLDSLTNGITNKVFKRVLDFGLDVTGEGAEEVFSQIMGNLGSALYREENLGEILASEEAFDGYLESFFGGAVLGGTANVGKLGSSIKHKTDYRTGLNDAEQSVFDAEYNKRLEEAQEKGKNLTSKEKSKISEEVMDDLNNGRIDIDTIEKALGGETYKNYQVMQDNVDALQKEFDELGAMKKSDFTAKQDDRYNELKQLLSDETRKTNRETLKTKLSEEVFNLAKDTRLSESYNEETRRGQAFQADLTKYDTKQQATIKKAVESGILNNTRRTHEFVDMVAKITADKGVSFDFTDNAKLKDSGFAIDGKSVNGYVTKDGVTVNIDSHKSLNSVVGHEIAHVLEGTELYTEMQKAVFEYAKSKNDYQGRYDTLAELYKNVEGANVDAELTADLVGDYLFTDADFVKSLSANRNVFQKIYDEIKYLCKIATTGSKEKRQLEQVKRAFDKAYKESGKAVEGVKYSLTDSTGKALTKEQSEYFKDSKMRDENGNLKVMYHGSQNAGFHVFDAKMSDDDTSLFFVDRNDVAASYSGTTETYEAQTIHTAEDMNNFIESIGAEGYEVVEKDGKFTLLYEGDRVADSNTAKGIYEEFCWYEGVGEGDANYKVYLNLKNPLVVDAEGRNWNDVSREYSQEVADKYNSLTAEEKAALIDLAGWEDYGIFRSELIDAVERGRSGNADAADKAISSAYRKLNVVVADLFTIASENFSEESIKQFAVKQMNTRDYAQKAKAEGYDGVIFKNIHDNGGYSNGSEGASTVAVAFDSNQIKSVANEKPTGYPDIRYSLSADSEGRTLSENQKKYFKDSKVVDENGNLKVVYHGSPSDFNTFSLDYLGTNGTAEGYGFYFTDSKRIAEGYSKGREGQQDDQHKGKLFEVYLDIKKPLSDTEVTMSRSQFKKFLIELNKQTDADGEPLDILSNYGDVAWEGLNNVLNYAMEIEYDASDSDTNMIHSIINSCGDMRTVFRVLREVTGYDGIIVDKATWGGDQSIYLAFHPEQIKNVNNLKPTSDPDTRRSLSENGAKPKQYGNYNVYGKDIGLKGAQKDVAPVREDVAKNATTTPTVSKMEQVEEMGPMPETIDSLPSEPTVYDLQQRKAELETEIKAAMEANDNEKGVPLINEYNELMAQLETAEAEENAMQNERFNSLTDADVPPEMDAPTNTGRGAITVDEKAVTNITNEIKTMMALDAEDTARMKETIQKYAQNPEMSDEELFDEVRRNYLYTEEYADANDEVQQAKTYMRGTKIFVPQDLKGDFNGKRRDGFNQFRKEHMGHFTLTTNEASHAMGIDQLYTDLHDNFPDLFPDNIITPAEQLQKMADVAVMAPQAMTRTGEYDTETIQSVCDAIRNGVEQYSQAETQSGIEAERASFYESIGAPIKDAPVKESYEAIKPQPETAQEPRMKRVKEGGTEHEDNRRRFAESATGSDAVDGKVKIDELDQELIHYQPISNKKTLETANASINRSGYDNSVTAFRVNFKNAKHKMTVDDIVVGERLIQEAAKRGDIETAKELIQDIAILGTELGQKVQALSIIKRLTPEGQLGVLTKTIERGKLKGDKAFEGVELTDEMVDHILKAWKNGTFDQNDLNRRVEDVKQQIADQMKVTKWDKVNAWRYLSMLGNPKTHGRNFVSNVANFLMRIEKNAIARTIEDVKLRNEKTARHSDDLGPVAYDTAKNSDVEGQQKMFFESKPGRTKTWEKSTDAVKKYADKVTAEEMETWQSRGKYSVESDIKSRRKIFENKALQWASEKNTAALEWEDRIFSKATYKYAFREFLTANGIKTDADIQNNPELIKAAKDYALEEAKRSTFQQDSDIADKIAAIEKSNPIYGAAVGSILPFKKTPINVAKTAVAYSPLGFARNIYDAVQVKKGNKAATEAIDNLAQTLTGTSLTLIGFALASMGVLNGAGKDDKEGEYDYQLGKQAYSINIGGDTYSLSWLSPVAMPLFVGTNMFEQLVEGKEWDANVVMEALGQTLDPLSEMSFLSSLNNVLSSYDSGMQKFFGIGEAMVSNYATQFIPTLSSQLAATFDDTKRTTRASADSEWKSMEQTFNSMLYKIPGLRNTLEPTTDIWGNEVKQTENILARGFESFIYPTNKREGIATETDEEIKGLYAQTGDSGVIPSIPSNYTYYEGQKYNMSAEEYTAYKQTYGQTANALMERLFNTNTYQNATAEERAKMAGYVYDYAREEATKELLAGRDVDYTNATEDGVKYYRENPIVGAIRNDMTVDEYSFMVKNTKKYDYFTDVMGLSYEDYEAADEDTKRAYSWAYENPGKYTMSKVISDDFIEYYGIKGTLGDFEADKDEDGKSISGSKKEKVIDYINNELDLDYGQKIILYRSMYNSQEDRDKYNRDIVEYLESRDDVSWSDMKTILEELGFTVSDNGRITWD